MVKNLRAGFLGAGAIAQSHAYALDALKYYYKDIPTVEKTVVASPTPESRESFAERFGFSEAIPPDEIWERDDLDMLYILGPNQTHTTQLLQAVEVPAIQRIYIEKPISISLDEVHALEALDKSKHGKFILVGFQYLQKSPVRQALAHWRSGVFGSPVHFRVEYLHGTYLDPVYREAHRERLVPAPVNGALVDLGSHIISLLIAFLGDGLTVKSAAATVTVDGTTIDTDLCTTALLEDSSFGAAGTLTASRVSAGTKDQLILEIRGTHGALVFDTSQPDIYKSYIVDEGWRKHEKFGDYMPDSKFPSANAPSGWLRALVHNHYLFLGGKPGISFLPDLAHGIQVQKLLLQIVELIH
jgi:predicted dehydrogenase